MLNNIPKNNVILFTKFYYLKNINLKITTFVNRTQSMSKMGRNYGNKLNVNIKMTFMYNKLWNKQDGLFYFSRPYLHKGQR
jgi:hypothetical protein